MHLNREIEVKELSRLAIAAAILSKSKIAGPLGIEKCARYSPLRVAGESDNPAATDKQIGSRREQIQVLCFQ